MGPIAHLTLEWRGTDAECIFLWLWTDELSLVVDVIRHYGRVLFRGFVAFGEDGQDISRWFPFPASFAPPFSVRSDGDWVSLDLVSLTMVGWLGRNPPVAFNLGCHLGDAYFNAVPCWLRRFDWTRAVSLLQEDFPRATFDGTVTASGRTYSLDRARGAIVHHWGWRFPNYLFLACHGFSGDPDAALTFACAAVRTRWGVMFDGGYLYLLQHGGEDRMLIAPLRGTLQYAREGDTLVLTIRHSSRCVTRIVVDPGAGVAFPHVFNTDAVTVLGATCELEGVGVGRAVLDAKGLDVVPWLAAGRKS